MRKPRTFAQKEQDQNRSRAGKYTKGPVCDFCNKPAGHDYISDDESLSLGSHDDFGLYLCARVRCSAKRDALSLDERRKVYAQQRQARYKD